MTQSPSKPLILGVTGASGTYAARSLAEKSPWPVDLIASRWGREVAARELGGLDRIEALSNAIYSPDDLTAPHSSGSVPTVGMVVLPCSAHTLAQIAAGLADSLISRAAHCHLKEKRPLVLCLREAPLTLIDLDNARKAAAAGAVIMPMSPPFFMFSGSDARAVSMADLLDAFVDRILAVLGSPMSRTWEDIR